MTLEIFQSIDYDLCNKVKSMIRSNPLLLYSKDREDHYPIQSAVLYGSTDMVHILLSDMRKYKYFDLFKVLKHWLNNTEHFNNNIIHSGRNLLIKILLLCGARIEHDSHSSIDNDQYILNQRIINLKDLFEGGKDLEDIRSSLNKNVDYIKYCQDNINNRRLVLNRYYQEYDSDYNYSC